MDNLFADIKTDLEKANFFLAGRGYETGVIAHAIQSDVAMAYQRCNTAAAELRRLEHNTTVLMNALMKACGDDAEMVKEIIEPQGELK